MSSGSPIYKFNITTAPARVDSALAQVLSTHPDPALKGLSRSQLQKLAIQGKIKINNQVVRKASIKVQPGDVIELEFQNGGCDDQGKILPFELKLEILFEDEDLLVVNKPIGLTMHPGAGTKDDTLINAVEFHRQELAKNRIAQDKEGELPTRGGVVHRLDRDTSGLVVVAKTVLAHADLSKQFADRSAGRRYLALACATPRSTLFVPNSERGITLNAAGSATGTIRSQFGRHPRHRTQMAVLKEGGRVAITDWELIERFTHAALLKLKLKTGRTHQIRVHLEYIGAPLVGEQIYKGNIALPAQLARAADSFGRQALHAAELEFQHPTLNKRMAFSSSPPADFEKLVRTFREFNG